MTRSGPIGQGRTSPVLGVNDPRTRQGSSTDRAYKAPVFVENGKVTLRIDASMLEINEDGELTLVLEDIAAKLAIHLVATAQGIAERNGTLTLIEGRRVMELTQAISSPPTQAEVQAIQAKLNELIASLVEADHLQET